MARTAAAPGLRRPVGRGRHGDRASQQVLGRCCWRSAGLALLLALGGPRGSGASEPRWWRLRCNGATAEQWHLCDLSFWADPDCSKSPNAPIEVLATSPAELLTLSGADDPQVLAEWKSACAACDPGVFLAAKFASPVVVQGVSFRECGEPTDTTTGTTTSAHSSPQGTGTTTVTTTTVNPFTGIDFGGGGGGGGGRLLAAAGACEDLVLERAEDGVEWSAVAAWLSPQPGQPLSLAGASWRPPASLPQVGALVNGEGNSVSAECSSTCYQSGVAPDGTLTLNFSEPVYAGDGAVELVRGEGSPWRDTLVVEAADGSWFQFDASQSLVHVVPQEYLGLSSNCASLSLQERAFVTADGWPVPAGLLHSYCLKSYEPLEVITVDPVQGSASVVLRPTVRLVFGVPLQVPLPGADPATLEEAGASGWLLAQTIGLGSASVRVSGWRDFPPSDLIDLTVPAALQPGTTYRLTFPPGAVADDSGNIWTGRSLTFTTLASLGEEAEVAVEAADDSVSTAALVAAVLAPAACCCCCIALAALGVWWWNGRQESLGSVPFEYVATSYGFPPPRPAWEAQSGTTSGATPKGSPQPLGPQGDLRRTAAAASPWRSPAAAGSKPSTRPSPGAPRPAPQQGGDTEDAERQSPTTPVADPTGGAAPGAAGRHPLFSQPRAREAEDVGRGVPPPAASRGARQSGAFTEDSTDGDGWVRMTETSTGRPYWLHPQTKEARWEPPPRRGAPGRPQRHPAEGGGPPPSRRAGEGPGASPTGSREPKPPPEPLDETSRVRASVLEGLRRTEREEIGSRKKNYKFLLLQWHPDKNPDKAELATEIFQFLQQQRDWYLKE